MKPFQPKPSPAEPPYIIAHRGISAKAPENTLAAFQRAVDVSGIDMIELDVRLTKDEQVIVLHDRTLQRTSTGNGPARNYTLAEIKRFDAGSWFHPAFVGERVPTLEEVLQLVQGKLWVDIEIKSDWLHGEPAGLLEDRVWQVVTQCGMESQVLFSSFNHTIVQTLKQRHPAAFTAVLHNFSDSFIRTPATLATRVHASGLVCAKREMNRRLIEDAHARGIAVYVYTLNALAHVQKVLSCGADGIISNNADDIIAVVKNM